VTGEWRKLHNEEFSALYSSPKLLGWSNREEEWDGGTCSTYGERRGAYRILVWRPERRRRVGRRRRRWQDDIKMDLQDVGWGHGLDWSSSG
jgi:hypothetical protein